MTDSTDPADLRPGLRTLEQIRNEALAKRDKLAHDMIAASSGSHGGSGSRGVQLDTLSKGLAWLQGGIDADYILPKLHPLFAELLLHGVGNVPSWKGEPKSDVEALEILDSLLACCKGAIEHTGSSLPRRIGEDGGQPRKLLTGWHEEATPIHPGDHESTPQRNRIAPPPETQIPALSQRQYEILEAMHLLKALNAEKRKTTSEIVDKAEHGANPEAFKEPIADLKKREFIATREGRGGGCWLTSAGLALIKQIKKL